MATTKQQLSAQASKVLKYREDMAKLGEKRKGEKDAKKLKAINEEMKALTLDFMKENTEAKAKRLAEIKAKAKKQNK